jgi:hypothetical protein
MEIELAIAMPADRAYAAMIRDVVVHSVRQGGLPEATALHFALMVEDAVRALVGEVVSDERLGVLVRMDAAPVPFDFAQGTPSVSREVQVTITLGGDMRTLTLDV